MLTFVYPSCMHAWLGTSPSTNPGLGSIWMDRSHFSASILEASWDVALQHRGPCQQAPRSWVNRWRETGASQEAACCATRHRLPQRAAGLRYSLFTSRTTNWGDNGTNQCLEPRFNSMFASARGCAKNVYLSYLEWAHWVHFYYYRRGCNIDFTMRPRN